MRIKWYGTASLVVESGKTRVLIDPYLRKLNPKLPPVPVTGDFGAVFITHPHLDHFSDIGAFLEAGVKRVYVSENGMAHARENGISTQQMRALSAGQTISIGDLIVRTYQSRHCKFDLATILSVVFHPRTYLKISNSIELLRLIGKYKIKDDIYALDISDGKKRVTVLGSAGMDPDERYPRESDLFVFPYQGRSRMHRYLKRFLLRFSPRRVMIDHFDDAFPPFTHRMNTSKFIPTVKETLPTAEAFIPEEGVWYDV